MLHDFTRFTLTQAWMLVEIGDGCEAICHATSGMKIANGLCAYYSVCCNLCIKALKSPAAYLAQYPALHRLVVFRPRTQRNGEELCASYLSVPWRFTPATRVWPCFSARESGTSSWVRYSSQHG